MYCIFVYDVGIERVNKVHKYLKRYLTWIQNSVFEGELGEADSLKVKKELKGLIDKEVDSVLIFQFRDKFSFEKQILGCERNSTGNII